MRFSLITALALAPSLLCAAGPKPDFGPNVLTFDPSMTAAAIQERIQAVYAIQEKNQFGPQRNALLFLPGQYSVDVPIGYYTQVLGLGATPDAVRIKGNVHSDASLPRNNATCSFWRGAEGFSVEPTGGTMQWAVSQAAPFRRMHVRGNMVLHQSGGWASGGWMSDDWIDGTVGSGSQQQWISRNTNWGGWTGSNWNMVFVGVNHPPEGEWPTPPYTKIARVPVVREKPFLQVDAAGNYSVRVPSLRTDSSGITWEAGSTPGQSIPLSRFYIARAGVDTADSLNAQLSKGKNLLLTPGIYELSDTLRIAWPDTIVLGLGFATLHANHGVAAMTTADVDGIVIAGLFFDAGADNSPVLLEVGPSGSKARHAKNPISLHDVFFRVGGAAAGRASVNLRINSSDTIVDHTWIWRADHGAGVGWTTNPSANGLVVNGAAVTIYGLFVEHYQEYQVLWNGEGGRVYFYQSEIPYDPPDQPSYTSGAGVNGWASYKVADNVTTHEAWGLGIYSVFRQPGVVLSRAIEVPDRPGVRFHSMITVRLGNNGEITNVINNTGGPAKDSSRVTPKVTSYPQ
ncbi:MAG TPA: hypothetical protein VG456_24070 [Candidatus Sulfopaludibacter sp.]|jgi:hypothetical protein|nr:hypothetical protein [Candidatus Sulfopaludibacter sp.]